MGDVIVVTCFQFFICFSDRSAKKKSFAVVFPNTVKNFVIFTGKHLCWSLFLITFRSEGLQLYLKETPTQVFFCEYCEIFKNSYFHRTPRVAASVNGELRNHARSTIMIFVITPDYFKSLTIVTNISIQCEERY